MRKIKLIIAFVIFLTTWGITVYVVEKIGLPAAQSEIESEKMDASWRNVPIARDYFPNYAALQGRLFWDLLVPFIAALGLTGYYLKRTN